MAEAVKLVVMLREGRGTSASRRLRRQGQVPGVIYGHGEEPVAFAVEAEQLGNTVRRGSRVIDVDCNGKTEKTLLREVQWDVFGQEILHVDLTRISLDEKIEVQVSLELRGTPKGVHEGGTLQHLIHEVTVRCLAIDIPTEIRVLVGELVVGGAIHVRDLAVLEGVEILADPDALVARVVKVSEEFEAAAPEAGPAEPEIIGRREAAEAAEEGEETKK